MRYARVGIILVLLAGAAAVNYISLPRGDEAVSDVPPPPPGRIVLEPAEPVEPVPPIGPSDAPVRLEVFYEIDNPCHAYIEPDARKLADRYAPYVCLRLLPWHAEGTEARAEELSLDCLVAVAVSGRTEQGDFEPGEVAFTAPTEIGGWSWDEVAELVEAKLALAGVTAAPQAPSDGPPEVEGGAHTADGAAGAAGGHAAETASRGSEHG